MTRSSVPAPVEEPTVEAPEAATVEVDPVLDLIRDRTARGFDFYVEFGAEFVEVAPGVVRVPSRSGEGFYDVDTRSEECPCPDYEHRTSKHGVGCGHVFGVAIARARRAAARRAVRCDCCGGLFRLRALAEVGPENTDGLSAFAVGDKLCRTCARVHGVA